MCEIEDAYAQANRIQARADSDIAHVLHPYASRIRTFAELFGADSDEKVIEFIMGPVCGDWYHGEGWDSTERLIGVSFMVHGWGGCSDESETAYFPVRWLTDNTSVVEARAEIADMKAKIQANGQRAYDETQRQKRLATFQQMKQEFEP